jgi:tRNA (mo5U34)-methyltransferase
MEAAALSTDLSPEALRELAASVPWYHTMDLGDGFVTSGEFDLRPVLPAYGFPEDMSGLSVLDIGRASGFFSFEFERRGARVTATELPDPHGGKDFVGGEKGRQMLAERWKEVIAAMGGVRRDFEIAHRLLNSKVEPLAVNIYDISPAITSRRRFDITFAGSILNHLDSPMAALKAVRSVTAGKLIFANPYEPRRLQTEKVARLVGRDAGGLTTWWLPTIACMEEMLYAAGFSKVELVTERVDLPFQKGSPMPHFVMHASNDG